MFSTSGPHGLFLCRWIFSEFIFMKFTEILIWITYTARRAPPDPRTDPWAPGVCPGGCRTWLGGRTGIWWFPPLACTGLRHSTWLRGRGSLEICLLFADTPASADPTNDENNGDKCIFPHVLIILYNLWIVITNPRVNFLKQTEYFAEEDS